MHIFRFQRRGLHHTTTLTGRPVPQSQPGLQDDSGAGNHLQSDSPHHPTLDESPFHSRSARVKRNPSPSGLAICHHPSLQEQQSRRSSLGIWSRLSLAFLSDIRKSEWADIVCPTAKPPTALQPPEHGLAEHPVPGPPGLNRNLPLIRRPKSGLVPNSILFFLAFYNQ